MKHFSLEQWLDFVRGLAPADGESSMHTHLASGCNRCNRIVRRYRALVALARSDSDTEIPETVADRAKQVFLECSWERISASAALSGRPLFDSLLQAAPAGIRGPRAAGRQVLYRFGRYYVDLRERHDPRLAKAALIGQIADGGEPTRLLARLPALLMSGNTIIARALTNDFGEFQMEYRPRKKMTLVLMMENTTARVDISPRPEGMHPAWDPGPPLESPSEE